MFWLFLIVYLSGIISTVILMWRINKKSGCGKVNLSEFLISIYFVLLSWVGFFALIAGGLAGYNDLNDEY